MHVADRPWGFWTESKLDMLSAYLPAFTTASKSAPSTVYLDLFTGQATNVSQDTGRPIEGSLLRALQTTPPFTVVRGFELQKKRAQSLQDTFQAEFPNRDVVVHAGDVHDTLQPALAALTPYRWSPTFAFIDPDGVEAIGNCWRRWPRTSRQAGRRSSFSCSSPLRRSCESSTTALTRSPYAKSYLRLAPSLVNSPADVDAALIAVRSPRPQLIGALG